MNYDGDWIFKYEIFSRSHSLDDQVAIHDHPVTGKGAQVRVSPGCGGGLKINRLALAGTNDVGVTENIIGLGNVLTFSTASGFRVKQN